MKRIKLYQPSNGTEGMIFMEQFCDKCWHETPGETPEGSCPIPLATMLYSINDAEYPNQWRYVDGKPTCISFFSRESKQGGNHEE